MTDNNLNADLIIELDPEYREQLLKTQKSRMGIGKRRSGIHVSDLLMCIRKSWAERQSDYVMEPSDRTVLTWLRGLSHEDLMAEGIQQVRAAYCFECDTVYADQVYTNGSPTETCRVCRTTMMIGTVDWVSLTGDEELDDYIPVEMKSTLKSARKTLDDMAWYADQDKTYMAIHKRNEGKIGVLHIMGDYKRTDPDERSEGPDAQFIVYKLRWRDPAARLNWLAVLKQRKQKLEDLNHMPLLDEDSPGRHPFICDYCVVGEKLPNGEECEAWPYRKLANGTYVRKGSAKQDLSMDDMMEELRKMSEGGTKYNAHL